MSVSPVYSAAMGCELWYWLWRCESSPEASRRVPNCSTPPRFGCRCAASLWGASPPRAAPTRVALVVVRNVLRLSPAVRACLSMRTLLKHEDCLLESPACTNSIAQVSVHPCHPYRSWTLAVEWALQA